ncbi:MAG: hypothetical protein WEC33_05785 [Dehalococcoidia bacterium]
MTDQITHDPATSLGAFSPGEAAVAVVQDVVEGQKFADELVKAGYPREGVRLWKPEEVIQGLNDLEERRNPAQWLGAFLSDEDQWAKQYVDFAEAGHAIVMVAATVAEDARAAVDVARRHPVKLMRHYGGNVVTDLLPE